MEIRKAVVFLISTVILLCYFYSLSIDEISRGKLDIKKTAKDIFDYCPFEPLDPWREEVAEHIHDKHGFKNCAMQDDFRPKTKLLNGTILVTDTPGLVCKGRCLWYANERSTKLGEWKDIDSKFLCDFVETACSMDQFDEAQSARFVHKQIVEQRNKSEERLNIREHPDLHIIILDSVGSSQFIRALPRTANYLINGMEAIIFRKFNRVGKNSKPNAFPAFFGLTIEEVERMIMNLPRMEADLSKKEYCKTYLDNHKLIPFEYKKKGYKTLMVDDYSEGFLTYTGCIGMKAEPHHHTYRHGKGIMYETLMIHENDSDGDPVTIIPKHFVIACDDGVFANKRDGDKELEKILWKGLCKDSLANELEYLSLFLNSYQDVPKFSLSWMNDIAHDNAGDLYSNDYDLYTFLKNHSKTLKNSFFFFYGDHGCRFGKEAKVAGILETSNPFLYIVIPERYRQSPIYEQLLKNSKELVTPHDLHSTFKDILYFQPQYNFTDITFKNFTSNPRGSSLLRQFQENKSRNCKTLPIPYKYCICQYGRKAVRDTLEDHSNVTLNQMFGQSAIERLNKILSSHSPKCHPLVLNNVTKIELFVLPNNESVKFEANAYEVTFTVSGPVEAIFKVPFRVEGNAVVLGSNTFTRIDVDEVITADETWKCKSGISKTLFLLCFCLLILALSVIIYFFFHALGDVSLED